MSDVNAFERSVEEKLAALRLANEQGYWGIPKETFERLADTAKEGAANGSRVFRSFRIRFGEGEKGVNTTFEEHCIRLRRNRGDLHFTKSPHIRFDQFSALGKEVWGAELAKYAMSHAPTVEWVNVELVEPDDDYLCELCKGNTLAADEAIVLAWLFPKIAQTEEISELLALGYRLNLEKGYPLRGLTLGVEFGKRVILSLRPIDTRLASWGNVVVPILI